MRLVLPVTPLSESGCPGEPETSETGDPGQRFAREYLFSQLPRVLGVAHRDPERSHTCAFSGVAFFPWRAREEQCVRTHWRDVSEATAVPTKGLFKGEFNSTIFTLRLLPALLPDTVAASQSSALSPK